MYFQARKKAATYNERLWSREGAAELLGISVSTLADYELGNTKVVPVDKVVLLSMYAASTDTFVRTSPRLTQNQYSLTNLLTFFLNLLIPPVPFTYRSNVCRT